jgi:hypothetical protein
MPNHVHLIICPATFEGPSRAFGEAHRRYAWELKPPARRDGMKRQMWVVVGVLLLWGPVLPLAAEEEKPANGEAAKEEVFSAGGYHDLTTSYFATQYMLEHSGINPERVTIRNYAGGHMMYLYQPSLEALSDDIVAFIGGD